MLQRSNKHQFSKKRRAKEVNFLKQACLQASVFTCELITYFILSPHVQNKTVVFFMTTFAWVSVHTLDRIITLAFNKEFKQAIFGKLLKGSPAVRPQTVNVIDIARESSHT